MAFSTSFACICTNILPRISAHAHTHTKWFSSRFWVVVTTFFYCILMLPESMCVCVYCGPKLDRILVVDFALFWCKNRKTPWLLLDECACLLVLVLVRVIEWANVCSFICLFVCIHMKCNADTWHIHFNLIMTCLTFGYFGLYLIFWFFLYSTITANNACLVLNYATLLYLYEWYRIEIHNDSNLFSNTIFFSLFIL